MQARAAHHTQQCCWHTSMLLSASGGTGQLQNAAGTPSMLLSASGGTGQLQNAAGTPSMLLSASGGTGQLQNAAGTPSMLLSASGGTGSFLTGHSVTSVSQDQTTGINCTVAQEDPVQVNATGYDNPTEQQPAGGLGQSLRGLGLPTEEASQAEVVHTTSAIGGLPAESSSYCQQPLQLQPPSDNQATRKGHGRGAADGTRQCGRCRKHAAVDVLLAGHDCVLYLISIGKDPRQYAHTQGKAAKLESLPTMEQAQEELAAKKRKSVKEWSGESGKQKKRKLVSH
ncbi:TPA: hypothetical protein ACH3X1_009811 [Trebouxia sp. C0004]